MPARIVWAGRERSLYCVMGMRVSSALDGFLRWWGGERAPQLPGVYRAAKPRSGKRLVISAEPDCCRLIRESGGRSETLARTPASDPDRIGEIAAIAKA
jgi:hypothetical protein